MKSEVNGEQIIASIIKGEKISEEDVIRYFYAIQESSLTIVSNVNFENNNLNNIDTNSILEYIRLIEKKLT